MPAIRTGVLLTGSMYTIGELATAAGVPVTTLRYYERAGLLWAEKCNAANCRLYSSESVGRIILIRAAKAMGLTLRDVTTLLGAEDGKTTRCAEVRSLLADRLTTIESRLHDLRQVRDRLKSALARCVKTQQNPGCHVIDALRNAH